MISTGRNFDNPEHRAASVRVESGNWLFCTDMAFRGDCRVLGPGEYSQPLMGGIASARQVWSPRVRLGGSLSPLVDAEFPGIVGGSAAFERAPALSRLPPAYAFRL